MIKYKIGNQCKIYKSLGCSKRSFGFTLAELLVVIATLGILAIILFPILGQYFSRARNVQRITDVKNIDTAMKTFAIDHGGITPNVFTQTPRERSYCFGMQDGDICWEDYMFQPQVVSYIGRNGGIPGNSNFTSQIREYLTRIPNDPQPTRKIGDRYIFGGFAGDPHCNGAETVGEKGWIIWMPEKLHPSLDSDCLGQGTWACCSDVHCGYVRFCLVRVGEF